MDSIVVSKNTCKNKTVISARQWTRNILFSTTATRHVCVDSCKHIASLREYNYLSSDCTLWFLLNVMGWQAAQYVQQDISN